MKNISKLSRQGFRVHNRDVEISRPGNFIDVRSRAIESSPGGWGGHGGARNGVGEKLFQTIYVFLSRVARTTVLCAEEPAHKSCENFYHGTQFPLQAPILQ